MGYRVDALVVRDIYRAMQTFIGGGDWEMEIDSNRHVILSQRGTPIMVVFEGDGMFRMVNTKTKKYQFFDDHGCNESKLIDEIYHAYMRLK